MLEKTCRTCNKTLDILYFPNNGNGYTRKDCKTCHSVKNKLNYSKDKRNYINVTCLDCNQTRNVRSDTKSASKTLCGSCSAKRRKGTQDGLSRHPAYKHWHCMKNRCRGGQKNWENAYVKKGITICEEWKELESFIKWAENNGFQKGLELDRIDNNKGYSPDNCRFVTRKENVRNSSIPVKVIRSDGKEYETITDAAIELGITSGAINFALKRNGSVKGFSFSRCN